MGGPPRVPPSARAVRLLTPLSLLTSADGAPGSVHSIPGDTTTNHLRCPSPMLPFLRLKAAI